jgi:hypothetical protein
MTELLARVSELFVAPAARPRPAATVATLAPAVAVLCPPADILSQGSAVAMALATLAQRRSAALAVWCPAGDTGRMPRAPGMRVASRLAAAAAGLGLEARASGRIARILLPADTTAAASAGQRLTALDAPTAIVLAGPRDEAIDRLLVAQDAVVVLRRPEDSHNLVALTLEGLPAPARALAVTRPRAGPAAWWTASLGLGLAPSLHRALTSALRGV